MTRRQTGSPSKRCRVSSKKSRNGCRTCRVRHVKCDETPGACKNCASTGRSCDYDLQRLPRGRKGPATKDSAGNQTLLFPEVVGSLRWAVTSDERRCFSHFQYHTVPTILEFFDSPLWQRLVLDMALSEPAVYHAVVALSAVHQDSEMHGMPLPGQDLQNTWHRFALEQCGRSFAILNRRHASRDPRLREVMLVCCLLFVMMGLLRGQYDDAFNHLQCGLRILKESRFHKQYEPSLGPGLIGAFKNLEIQSVQFGVAESLHLDDEEELGENQGVFRSLEDARQAFHPLLNTLFRFLVQCEGLSEATISRDYASLQLIQMNLLSELSRFGSSFESFCSYRVLNRKEQKGADIMRLMHRSSTLAAMACFVRSDAILDCYNPEYKKQVSMVEDIMNRFPERPSFTLDIGIILTLYFAAMWCRDFTVRCRAIEILRSWPHREGSFDSNWAAFLALERMKAESLTQSQPDVISPSPNQLPGEEKRRWPDVEYGGYTLEDALRSTKCMRAWPCIQNIQQLRSSGSA